MVLAFEALWPGEANAVARHRQMAKYFERQACPESRRAWQAAPRRAISELSYQRIHCERLRQLEHLFCDLGFVQASIARGLFEQLCADLHHAAAVSSSPAIDSVRSACVSGAQAIGSRPRLALEVLVNRLRLKPLPEPLAARVKRAEQTLDFSGELLVISEGVYSSRPPRDVVCISAQCNLIHTLSGGAFLDDRELESHQLVEQHALGCTATPADVTVSVSGQVACAERDGAAYLDGAVLPLKLRRRWPCFGFVGERLVGVSRYNRRS